jgi:hypothetical protein
MPNSLSTRQLLRLELTSKLTTLYSNLIANNSSINIILEPSIPSKTLALVSIAKFYNRSAYSLPADCL